MAHLAIQGHATRGNEVIDLLKMLGGKNIPYGNLGGNNPNEVYYIDKEGYINWSKQASGKATFTLEDFARKYPYKVGDKVVTNDCDVCKIHSMYWDRGLNRISYILETPIGLSKGWGVNELQPAEEKTNYGREEDKSNVVSKLRP